MTENAQEIQKQDAAAQKAVAKAEKALARVQAEQKKESLRHAKLSTLGHFAWVFAVLGALIAILSGFNASAMVISSAFWGLALTFWIVWLAIGALIDEIRKRFM